MVFQDRIAAGRKLARKLEGYKKANTVVYALPRGGVVVAAEVAEYLHAPLGLILAKKISHPLSPEYAIGAVTETGEPVWDEAEITNISPEWRKEQTYRARQEARRWRIQYLSDHPNEAAAGKVAIIVDDGMATGFTMVAAMRELRRQHPQQIVVAIPIALFIPDEIVRDTDEVIALHVPSHNLGAIGTYYQQFEPVSDEEVRQLLDAYHSIPTSEPLDLAALNAMLATIDHYPVASGVLADQAERLRAPTNVVHFFKSIPKDIEFTGKADVMRRSQEVEILMEEEVGQL